MLPMAGFESGSSGIGSDRSANCPILCLLLKLKVFFCIRTSGRWCKEHDHCATEAKVSNVL